MPITTLDLERLLASTSQADFGGRTALTDISTSIAKAKRVVVVSGAGISCSSGIPDFRSADGLYSLVKSRYPDAFFTGKDLFSSGLFSNPSTTSIFYTFIAELYLSCQAAKPTRTHHLIHKLESKGKLLRSYTQNVDGLERRMGLESGGRGQGFKKRGTRNVELHGDLGRVRCVLCMKDYEAKLEWVWMFRDGQAPDCPACIERSESRIMRSARATSVGTLRPSIVLYDEQHPLGDDIGDLQTYDIGRNPDLLLIMGTSLKVHGLKRVVKEFAKTVHSRKDGLVVFVNATPPSKEWEGIIDIHVHGQTDVWAEKVEEDWKKVRPADWEIQTRLDGEVGVTAGGREKVKKQVKEKVVKEKKATGAQAEGKVRVKKETKPKVKAEVKPKIEKGTAKPRAPRKSKAKPAAQLPPTPRQSKSPVSPMSSPLTDLSDLPSESDVDSCIDISLDQIEALPTAPPTPISPHKRRPTSASFDPKGRSPMKKTKSFNDHPTPTVITGLKSSPGSGNLFAPKPDNVAETEINWGDIDSSDPFLSPSPSKPARVFRRTRTLDSLSMPMNANVLFGPSRRASMFDKENVEPGWAPTSAFGAGVGTGVGVGQGRRVTNISAHASMA